MHLIERAIQDLKILQEELDTLGKIDMTSWNTSQKRSHIEKKDDIRKCVSMLKSAIKQMQDNVNLNDQILIDAYKQMTAVQEAPREQDLVRELGAQGRSARLTMNVRKTSINPNINPTTFHHECVRKTMQDIDCNNLITSFNKNLIERRNRVLINLYTLIGNKDHNNNNKLWTGLPVELKKVVLYYVAVAESVAIGKKPQQIIALVDFLFNTPDLAENFKEAHQSKHFLTIKEKIITEGKKETYLFDFFPVLRVKTSTPIDKKSLADDNVNNENKVSQIRQ